MEEQYPTLAVSDNAPYVPLIARLLRAGSGEHRRIASGTGEDVVEFFDARHADTVHGRRICSYTVSEVTAGSGGLNLFLSAPEWALSPRGRAEVASWLAHG